MMHTKGPWKYDGDSFVGTDEPDSQTVCYLSDHRNQSRREEAETDANGRLIETAPNLLAACEGLVDYRDKAGPLNFQLVKADDFIFLMRAAIAAARGN